MASTIAGITRNSAGLLLPSDGTVIIKSNNLNIFTIDAIQNIQIATNTTIIGELTIPNTPLKAIYGGTGTNYYTIGDMLIADSTTTLVKLLKPAQNNLFLTTDTSAPTGISWNNNLLKTYLDLGPVLTNSNSSYTFSYLNTYSGNNNIIIGSTDIDLTTNGANGLAQSGILTGLISPRSLTNTIAGVGTLFATDLQVGDSIQCGAQNRTIVTIISNSSATIDETFTLLNQWSLVGSASLITTTVRFGTKALSADATTDYAQFILGTNFSAPITWTVEFFVNLSTVNANKTLVSSAAAFALSISFNKTSKLFTVSLGSNGSSFDIANASATTTPLVVTNTWYHIALAYSGANYKMFVNGLLGLTIAVATPVVASTFSNLKIGSDGTLAAGAIYDEFRLSSTARYSATFTAPTAPFTLDANTISLNHFEQGTVNDSDDTIAETFNYNLGGVANTKIYYCYALGHTTSPKYLVSRDSTTNTLRYTPSGYTNAFAKKMPMYFLSNSSRLFSSIVKIGNQYNFTPALALITNGTSVTPVTTSLANLIPDTCQLVQILVTHTHVSTTSCSVQINQINYLTSAIANNSYLQMDTQVGSAQQLISNLSILASTTSYSIALVGFYD